MTSLWIKKSVFYILHFQYLDFINVMAYDYYWTGYNFTMDIAALESIGVAKERLLA